MKTLFLGATGRVYGQKKDGWYVPKTRNSLEEALADLFRQNPELEKRVKGPITINDVMRGDKQ